MNDVDMAIDQSRHQRATAAIDHVGALALDGALDALAHAIILDQQLMPSAQLPVTRLQKHEILEVDLGHA